MGGIGQGARQPVSAGSGLGDEGAERVGRSVW